MEPYQPFTGNESNNTDTTSDINTTDTNEHYKNTITTNPFYNLPPEHISNATTEQTTGSLPQQPPPPPPSLQTDASVPIQHQQEQWHNSPPPLTNYPPYYPPPPPPFYQGVAPQLQNHIPNHHNNSQYDSLYHPSPSTGGPSFPGITPPSHSLDFVGGKNYGEMNEDDLDEHRPVVTLENKSLWQEFNEAGTEMIITKTGR